MTASHRRHDLSDRVWEHLRPHLPGEGDKVGHPARDNRRFPGAVFWISRTGRPRIKHGAGSAGVCSSARGGPVPLVLTEDLMADCTRALPLIVRQRRTAQYLLADKGYDTNAIVAGTMAPGMETVIPPRSHRKEPRYYDGTYTACVIWLRMQY